MREILPRIPAGAIDFIITDPPYNIKERAIITKNKGRGKTFGKPLGKIREGLKPEEYIAELWRVLKDGGVICCFYGNNNLEEMLIPFKSLFHFLQIGIWHKTNPPPAMRGIGFQNSCELFIVGRKGKKPHYFNKTLGQQHNFFSIPFPSSNKRIHPAQKPVKLFARIIERFTKAGETVLDPFLGVGTTAQACLGLGRNCIGIEIDLEFYQEACNAATL